MARAPRSRRHRLASARRGAVLPRHRTQPMGLARRVHFSLDRAPSRIEDELFGDGLLAWVTNRSGARRLQHPARRARGRVAPVSSATSSRRSRPSRTRSSAPPGGVLVCRRPGNGKTVVALHRRLSPYTFASRSRTRGAGRRAQPLFLRYIERVLPLWVRRYRSVVPRRPGE